MSRATANYRSVSPALDSDTSARFGRLKRSKVSNVRSTTYTGCACIRTQVVGGHRAWKKHVWIIVRLYLVGVGVADAHDE